MAEGDDASVAAGVDASRTEIGALVAAGVAFDLDAFAAEHEFGVVHADRPDSSGVARLADTTATVAVLVPDADGPSPLQVLDALRARTTLPVVLYSNDVDADDLASFLAAEATDYVREHPDGSERVLAERVRAAADHASLAESHALLERAVDQAEIGITIADARTEEQPLIYANEGFARLTGYDVASAVGRNCRFLQGEETDPATVAALRSAIDDAEPLSVDLQNYRADGTRFWNRLDISPVFDDDGDLTHYLGFQREVTERKRLQTELREQNERLETFASVVSHDLRNPLAVARGHLDRHHDDELDPAREALERMENLVEDVLALARQGDVVEEPDPVTLGEVATYAWSMVDTGDLALELPEDVVVHADRTRLVSIFENLFRNSVEHATGATTVTVTATADGFRLADDGPGIPADAREEIFERGVSTTEGGTGFGLAIVDAIATAHGWTVTVTESERGGVAFEFGDVTVETPS